MPHIATASLRRTPPLRLILAIFAMLAGAPALADDVVRVFLFAGQSNMVGSDAHADRIDEFPPFQGAGARQADVRFTYILGNGDETSRGWTDLGPQSAFGPELTFARRYKQHVHAPLAIIKSAVGGTTVAFDWNPDAPEKGQKLYPRTLKLVRESLQQLEEQGIPYRLEGVCWHQGENDMLDRNLYKQYAAGLTKLIHKLRVDLNAPELKWYIAAVSEKGIWGMDHRPNLGILFGQQQEVLKADPLLRWVPTSHLAFEVMSSGQPHYHYGTQGQLQMGEAFADAYLRDLKLPIDPPAVTFDGKFPVKPKGRVRMFALAGQRNMEGEDAFVSELGEFAGKERLMEFNKLVLFRYSLGGGVQGSTDWQPLGPVSRLGNFGPELSLGSQLREAIPADDGVAVIKFTHSGAQGPDWWPQGSPETHRNLYPRFIRFLQAAEHDLRQQGFEPHWEGVFWHTGENDTWFGPYANNQAPWMKQLIEKTREDLKSPELRWLISEQHPNSPWKNNDKVNSSLAELAVADGHITIIPTAQLPHGRHHFGTRGTVLLGEEMANSYWKAR